MDFSGNHYAVQSAQVERSTPETVKASTKIHREDEECKSVAMISTNFPPVRPHRDSIDLAKDRSYERQRISGNFEEPSDGEGNVKEFDEFPDDGGNGIDTSLRNPENTWDYNKKAYNDYAIATNENEAWSWNVSRVCKKRRELTADCDVDRENEYYENSESGINISVVSLRETLPERKYAISPKYNVSVRRFRDRTRRKADGRSKNVDIDEKLTPPPLHVFLTTDRNKLTKFQVDKQEFEERDPNRYCVTNVSETFITSEAEGKTGDNVPNKYSCEEQFATNIRREQREEPDDQDIPNFYYSGTSHQHSSLCERKCDRCEALKTEIPDPCVDTYASWRNMDFKNADTCLEDCCCPREAKMYSSNTDVASFPCSGNHRFCDAWENDGTSGRNCFAFDYRTNDSCHFPDELNERFSEHAAREQCCHEHSACTVCSRQCTPSKASLFVETGESEVRFDNLPTPSESRVSGFDDSSMESIVSGSGRKKYSRARGKGKGFSKSREKLKLCGSKDDGGILRSGNCSSRCKTRPGIAGRCYSEEVLCRNRCFGEDAVEIERNRKIIVEDLGCNEGVRFIGEHECRTRMESNTCVNRSTSKNSQTHETRTLWPGVQKGKFFSQLHDACKSVIKIATTTLSQVVKDFSKPKHAQRDQKNSCVGETNAGTRRKDILQAKENGKQRMCDECAYDDITRKVDVHDNCEDHCFENIDHCPNQNTSAVRFCGYETPILCENDCHGPYREVRKYTPSDGSWYFDPHEGGVHGNVYAQSSCRGPLKDLCHPKHFQTRKRGGSDGHPGYPGQKRKSSNSNQRPHPDASRQSNASASRGNVNSRNEGRKRRSPTTQENNYSRMPPGHDKTIDLKEAQQNRIPPGADYHSRSSKTFVGVYVQSKEIRMDTQPAGVSRANAGAEREAQMRESIKESKKYSQAIANTAYVDRDDASEEEVGRAVSKWSTSSTQEVNSMMEALASKQEAMKQGPMAARKQKPPSPRKAGSKLLSPQKQGTTAVAPSMSPKPEVNNRADVSTVGRGSVGAKELPAPTSPLKNRLRGPKGTPLPVDKDVQCQIIRRYQIICVDDATKHTSRQVQELCQCTPRKLVPPGIVTSQELPKLTELDAQVKPINGHAVLDEKPDTVMEALRAAEPPVDESAVPADKKLDVSKETEVTDATETTPLPATDKQAEVSTTPATDGATNGEEGKVPGSTEEGHTVDKAEPETIATEKVPVVVDEKPESIGPEAPVVVEEKPESIGPEVPVTVEEKPESIGPEIPVTEEKVESIGPEDPVTVEKVEPSDQEAPGAQEKMQSTDQEAPVAQEKVQSTDQELPAVEEKRTLATDRAAETPAEEKQILPVVPAAGRPTDLATTDSPGAPIEVFRQFNGNRTYVNVEMQTSNTILTKILSEFEMGKKKKRILMSIKLQAASDHDKSGRRDEDQDEIDIQTTTEYSSRTFTPETEMGISGPAERNYQGEYLSPSVNARQPLALGGPADNYWRRKRKTSGNKAVYPKSRVSGRPIDDTVCTNVGTSRRIFGVGRNGENGESSRRSSIDSATNTSNGVVLRKHLNGKDSCLGPCGRKKYRRFEE